MRKPLVLCFLLVTFFSYNLLVANSAAAMMPVPAGQQGFTYAPISSPILNDNTAAAYPIGVGSCAAGGTELGIQIGLNQVSGRIDVYFAIAAPDLTSEIFILTSAGGLQAVSEVGMVPWKVNISGPISESLFTEIPLTQLQAGTYYFVLLVAPTGNLDTYTFWVTSINGLRPEDYSGLYYVTLSVQPIWKMTITQSGSSVTFSLVGNNFLIEGQGSISGNTMALTADMPAMASTFNFALTFSGGGQQFSGIWEMKPGEQGGTVTGTKTPWPTYDVATNGLPHFASADVIELPKISRVSKLRSGIGHDYSDDFETCRSMKHYFVPKDEADRLTVKIYSPLNGTVIATTEEWSQSKGWTGTNVGIQSDDYPPFHLVIMHIDLIATLEAGDKVSAGQLLGTPPDYGNFTLADTAVGVNTPSGYKLVSFFDVMTNDVFKNYQARGLNSRNDAIISKAERDADPIACQGEEEFADGGNLENWVYLN